MNAPKTPEELSHAIYTVPPGAADDFRKHLADGWLTGSTLSPELQLEIIKEAISSLSVSQKIQCEAITVHILETAARIRKLIDDTGEVGLLAMRLAEAKEAVKNTTTVV